MNPRLAHFLLALGALFAFNCTAHATEGEADRWHGYSEQEPLTFGVVDAQWPYSYTDEGGNPQGLDVALTERLLERLGLPFRAVTGTADEISKGVNDSTIRLVIDETHVLSPDLTASKSIVALLGYGVAYAKGKPHIGRLPDVAAQRAYIDAQSQIYIDLAARGWQGNLDETTDIRSTLYEISSTGKGQLIGDARSMEWLCDNEHLDNVEVSHLETVQGKLRFISHDAQLIERIDSVYSVMRQNGELDDIYSQWLYPDMKDHHSVPQYVWVILALLALVALALIAFWLLYRYRVHKAVGEARQQNDRLNLILRSGDVEIWTYDVETKRFTWYSPDMQRSQELDRSQLLARVSQNDLERIEQAIAKVANGKARRETLHVTTTSDDNVPHNQEVTIAVLKQENGHPTQLIGTEHDTAAERKQRYEEEQTAKRYQMIFSESLIDLILFNAKGKMVDVNKHSLRTFKVDDIKRVLSRGPSLRDIYLYTQSGEIDPENFCAVTKFDFPNMKPEERHFPEIKLTELFYWESSSILIHDDEGNPAGLVVRGQDMTEWVNTFHKLRENGLKLQSTGKQVADIIDKVNYVIRTSGAKICSFHPENGSFRTYEAMNKVSTEYNTQQFDELIADDSKADFHALIERLMRRENSNFEVTLHVNNENHPDLPEYVRMNGIPQTDKQGNVESYFGSYIDMTEMMIQSKKLDARRQHALDEEKKMSEFLRDMSYEIRTPLNNVVGFSELFGMANNDADAHQFVSEIKQSATRLLNLINDVLTMARIDAGMTTANPKPTDVAANFARYCQSGWNAADKPVELRIEGGEQPLTVSIDTTMLQTIVHHLVDNASKFTDNGTVRCSYEYGNEGLTITVEDTGRGMTDEQATMVMGRFKKVNESDGSGLGLSVCKGMTDLMGGSITIASAPGQGTTVKVTLPCQRTQPETQGDK